MHLYILFIFQCDININLDIKVAPYLLVFNKIHIHIKIQYKFNTNMLDLYNSGFAFDDDNNYIMLDSDNSTLDIISTNKPGVDIFLDYTNLEHSIPEIPSTIKYLRINCRAFHYKNLILPSTLEYLHLQLSLSDIFKNNILDCIILPTSIKSLSIVLANDISANDIPDTIDNLLSNVVDKLLNNDNNNVKIPKNIEYLKINFELPNIEEYTNLKVLVLESYHNNTINYPLDNLPASLEWLEINSFLFNYPLDNLPSGLKVLIFSQNRIWNYCNGYMHSLDGLPSGLEVLHFPENLSLEGNKYIATLENLPSSIKILRIPKYMPDNMNYNCLPDSIEILEWSEFGKYYKKISRLPSNLKKIISNVYCNENINMLKHFENMQFTFEFTTEFYN